MATMTSELIVRLIDQVSGPASAAGRALRNLVSGASSRLDRALAANSRALETARAGMFDATASAVGLYATLSKPVAKASEFQTLLEDIAQKASLSKEATKGLGDQIKALSKDLGQSSIELTKAVDSLLGRGLDPTRAMAILPAIARTSAAYRAVSDDVARAAFAVMDGLKVPADQVAKSLDIMAAAGKEGAFELRNMAQEFPSLIALASTLGNRGTEGVARLSAALQVAMKTAGGANEAATNVGDMMGKITSQETVKKFSELGIDIRAELNKWIAQGSDPFEQLALTVRKALKGDMSRITEIFADKQARLAVLAMVENLDEYVRIRDKAGKASGVVDADFETRMQTAQAQMEKFTAAWERLQIALGDALLPSLTKVMDTLSPIIERFTEFANKNPQLVAAITTLGASFVALSIGLAAARYAFLLFQRGVLVGLKAIMVGIGPIGWALAGVAAAGAWIYSNWEGIKELVGGFVSVIKDQFPSLGPVFETLNGWIETAVNFVKELLKPVQMTKEEWRALGEAMGQSVASFMADVAAMPGKIASFFEALPGQLKEIGSAMIRGLWDGIVAMWDSMMASISAKVQELKNLFYFSLSAPSIRNSGGAPVPGMQRPNPLGDLMRSQRKSMGGRVSSGGSYWVGEQGPEIFRPNVNGSIVPNSAIEGGARITVNAPITINANDSMDGVKRAVAEIRRELASAIRGVQADTGLALA